jgi:hypothetical protein
VTAVRPHRMGLVLAATAMVVAGCGDDDATSGATAPAVVATTTARPTTAATSAAPATTAAPAATAAAIASFDKAGFCHAFLAVQMAGSAAGDPDADAAATAKAYREPARAAAALAPPELAAELAHSVELLQQAATSGDGSLVQEAFPTATTAWTSTNCGWTKVTATAEDYHFRGIPADLTAGDYEFDLSNTGKEFHVLLIAARKAGVTDSYDQLLGDPAAMSKLDTVLAVAAAPGASASNVTQLDPGEYVVLCPVAIGSTGDTPGTGPPHFTAGMRQSLTVAG